MESVGQKPSWQPGCDIGIWRRGRAGRAGILCIESSTCEIWVLSLRHWVRLGASVFGGQTPTSSLSHTVCCLVSVHVFPTASALTAVFHTPLPSLSSSLCCSFPFPHISSSSATLHNSLICCVHCLSSTGLLPTECKLYGGLHLVCSLMYSRAWHIAGLQTCWVNHSNSVLLAFQDSCSRKQSWGGGMSCPETHRQRRTDSRVLVSASGPGWGWADAGEVVSTLGLPLPLPLTELPMGLLGKYPYPAPPLSYWTGRTPRLRSSALVRAWGKRLYLAVVGWRCTFSCSRI